MDRLANQLRTRDSDMSLIADPEALLDVPVVPPRHRSRAFKVKTLTGGTHDYGPSPSQPSHDIAAERRTTAWRRALVFGGSSAITAAFTVEFYQVLSLGGITLAQLLMVLLFALTFFFVCLAAVTAVCGAAVSALGLAPSPVAVPEVEGADGRRRQPKTRTAILMATYNENPDRVFGSAVAMMESLVVNGAGQSFDFFILSDTTDPEIWIQEEQAFARARARLNGGARLFYRRRLENIGRKTGNLWQWLWRWGPDYDHMLVLDADSLMSGDTMIRMALAMEDTPDLGLLQTVPVSRGRQSIFARMQQFASSAYGPLLATGLAFWHRGESNFWGHNAIIRTNAFMGCAELPVLSGKPPLGGQILSHDFIEAAFLRRAGWRVAMAPQLAGSYEESPPSLIDFAQRDRRWCQGNLQHAKVLRMPGLHWVSRFHLVTGIMAYASAVLWLMFLTVGLLLVWQAQATPPDYFSDDFSLFPTWPRQDAERAIMLFVMTMGVLLLPKLLCLGWILGRKERRAAFGGGSKATASVLAETVISTLLAPIFMLMQSKAVFEVLTGRDSGWKPQVREDGSVDWRNVFRCHWGHMLIGCGLGALLLFTLPMVALWMSPALLGLALAAPLSGLTADPSLGRKVQARGLFTTPAESRPEAVAIRADITVQDFHQTGLMKNALDQLSIDPGLLQLHRELLTIHQRPRNKTLNEPLVLAKAKIDHASTLEALEATLTVPEKRALLANPQALELFEEKFATNNPMPVEGKAGSQKSSASKHAPRRALQNKKRVA